MFKTAIAKKCDHTSPKLLITLEAFEIISLEADVDVDVGVVVDVAEARLLQDLDRLLLLVFSFSVKL